MNRERLFIAAFLALAAALVVGQRFGFAWAGGAGYQAPRFATVVDLRGTGTIDRDGTKRPLTDASRVARGETVSTDAGGYALLAFDGEQVALDERTSVTVVENDAEDVKLNMTAGRLLANTRRTTDVLPVSIKTGQSETSLARGAVSVIDYDFLWRADLWPLRTTLRVTTPADGTFTTNAAVRVSTDGSAKSQPMAEDFDHGPSAAFYAWVQSRTPFR